MSFIVASGPSIEVGTTRLRLGALGAVMLASIVMAAVTVVIAPVFTTVIVVTLVVSGAGSLFDFFGVGVSICCL